MKLALVNKNNQRREMPSKNGYIKLWRDIKKQPFWKKDLEAKSIFIELIMAAQHTKKQVTYKNKVVSLDEGQLIISRTELGEDAGVDSESKIKRTLVKFDKLGITTRENVKHNGHIIGQIITLNNWEKWQNIDRSTDRPTDQSNVAYLKGLTGGSDRPTDQSTVQHCNNVSNNSLKEYAGQDAPLELETFLQERTDAFEDFWKTYSESKVLIGGKNKAPKAKTKSKFLNETFPASKIRKMGLEAFDQEVDSLLDLVWLVYSDIAQHKKTNTRSDWFNHENMWPAKFLSNAQWRDEA
jgi:hypothetical protein